MAGDAARAESLAQDLNKRFPLHTQMQSLWLPAIRAQLALDRKNSSEAVSNLQTVVAPTELLLKVLCRLLQFPIYVLVAFELRENSPPRRDRKKFRVSDDFCLPFALL